MSKNNSMQKVDFEGFNVMDELNLLKDDFKEIVLKREQKIFKIKMKKRTDKEKKKILLEVFAKVIV